MQMFKRSAWNLAVCGALVAGLLAGCGPSKPVPATTPGASNNGGPEPILIGGLGPLTGSGSGLGAGIRDGGQLAVKLINAKGGVFGRPLKLIMEDDGGDPAKASAAVKKLLDRDKVFMLFGGGASSSTIAAANIAMEQKVPFWVSTATAANIATPARRYIFRSNVNSTVESKVLTQLAMERYKPKTVGILAQASDYGKASADGIIAQMKELGYGDVQVVVNEGLAVGGADFSTQLLKFKAKNPDLGIVIAYPGELVPLMRQVNQMGIKTPMLQFSTVLMRGAVESIADNLPGVVSFNYTAEPISENAKHPGMSEFVREYKKEFGRYPDTIDLQGYQGLMLVVKALEKAGAVDREKFVDGAESMGTIDLGLFVPQTYSKENHDGGLRGTLLEFLPGRQVDGTLYGNVKIWSPGQ